MTRENEIEHMVSRFLQWRLPKDFRPDGGIQFDANAAKKLNPNNHTYEPVGTNLFTADQAKEMVRFMIEGLDGADSELLDRLEEQADIQIWRNKAGGWSAALQDAPRTMRASATMREAICAALEAL